MFMHLYQAGNVLLRASSPTEMEFTEVDGHIKSFCTAFYKYLYERRPERLELCRFAVDFLLNVVTSM